METTEVTAEKAAQVEATLREDVKWAIENRKWDPQCGANFASGKWIPSIHGCGVCAVGAHVLRRQLPPEIGGLYSGEECVFPAAVALGVPREWMADLFYAVAIDGDEGVDVFGHSFTHDDAVAVGIRLRAYADKLEAEADGKATA